MTMVSVNKIQEVGKKLCSIIFGYESDDRFEDWKKKYIKRVAFMWTLVLGPVCGWMGFAYYLQTQQNQVIDMVILISLIAFYLFGHLSRWRISLARMWVVIGLVTIGSMWYKYLTKNFNDDYESRLIMYGVTSGFYLVTIFVPLGITDLFFTCNYCNLY